MSSASQVKSSNCMIEKGKSFERNQSLVKPKESDPHVVFVSDIHNAQPAQVLCVKDPGQTAIEKECLPQNAPVTAVAQCTSDKFDDLTSLEREIAEMHHVEPAPVLAKRVSLDEQTGSGELDAQTDKVLLEMQPPSRNATPAGQNDAMDIGVSVVIDDADGLEHDDLIAVLKGIDHGVDDEKETVREIRAPSVASDGTLAEGVTIEGEGQFQIMEVIDDEADETENDARSISGNQPSATSVDNSAISVTVTAKSIENSGPTVSLTAEEARVVAMEQIAGLNATRQQRRRKQDIKPAPLETDLVSSLGAEWSDDDTNTDRSLVEAFDGDGGAKTTGLTTFAEAKAEVADAVSLQKRRNSPLKITSIVLLQSGKSQAEETHNTSKEKEVATTSAQALPISGFKRTRIIKRKIIWDPDAPETQFSFAQLVRGKSKPEVTVAATTSTSSKKEVIPAKKMRPATPKDKKLSTLTTDTGEVLEKKISRSSTPLRGKMSSANSQPSTKAATTVIHEAGVVSLPVKRRSQTPVPNGSSGSSGKKKKITEIDRLMGDEGAINMLNALECERAKVDSDELSDRPHKPLMRSRASAVTERVTKRETITSTTTTGTKKDALPIKTKRNAKSKASSTWDYVYKQQANEDSMIIRRRSNSSYSSSASMHRLSLDGPAKVGTKEASESSNSSSSTTGKGPTDNAKTSAASTTAAVKTAAKKTVLTSTKAIVALNVQANTEESSIPVSKTFEFAKPDSKPTQKTGRRTKSPMQTTSQLANDMKKAATITKRAIRVVEDRERIKPTSSIRSLATKQDCTVSLNTDVLIKKSASMAQIIFNTQKAKVDYTFTTKMLNKLVEVLDKMGKDKDCNAVVLSTNAQHFCQGLDFSDLAVGSPEKRKNSAVLLATAVKSYLKTLATFPKPLVAAVVGNNVGLGVMQLPLFDIVIASDKATYETPYVKMGQMPEGHCIWNNITKVRSNFKTKLMWLCEKLNATEGAVSGLVNKITPPSKVNDDAVQTAKRIAAMPVETFRIMKKTTITSHLDAIVAALDDEFDMIIEQWTAGDCYEHFKKTWEMLTQV